MSLAENMLAEARHEVMANALRVAGYVVTDNHKRLEARVCSPSDGGVVGVIVGGALKPSRLIPFHEQVAVGQIAARVLLLLQEVERFRSAVISSGGAS